MTLESLQDILPLVERPSRYLGTEINRIHKDPKQVKLRFALAFPDLYEIGTSHFGLQILYSILNSQKEIAAERIYAPGVDMEAQLRSKQRRLSTLESHTPVDRFDIIGFSLLYELNYTNILTILDLSHIPFYARERDESHPIVIAGGPCTCNPEPVADFFDAIIVGDGEEVVLQLTRTWMAWKEGAPTNKEALLKEWSKIEGIYVPSYFKPQYDSKGFQRLKPIHPDYTTVKRTIVSSLDDAAFPVSPVIPFGKPIHDRLRLEVARGCTRGCRFCQAGMIYRPVRERSTETLLKQAEEALAETGYGDLSLLSLSTGDHSCLVPLMESLITQGETDKVSVSLPSLRAGTLSPKLMALIKRIRKTGFTIAPEAGSQRLRNVINKNISETNILKTVEDAFLLGWQVIKLYFMVGLPTETQEDLDALVELVKDLRKIKPVNGRRGKINVSAAVFIPKPHTPFQWEPQISLTKSKEKIGWIRAALKLPGVQVKWQNPEVSYLEGLFARGDRRLSRLLLTAYQKGCRFDGWSDKFRFDIWESAISDVGIDVDVYTTRKRDMSEPLPWDHIDSGVGKGYLQAERHRALKEERTDDCRTGSCHDCGVCNFIDLKPIVYDSSSQRAPEVTKKSNYQETAYNRVTIGYKKMGQARFLGHLELQNIFLRAVRRAGIAIKYSEGFHPLPKISFDDALPIGLESEHEVFHLIVSDEVSLNGIKNQLNKYLPEGLSITSVHRSSKTSKQKKSIYTTYRVTLKEGVFDKKQLRSFLESTTWMYTRQNKRGKTRTVDLKEIVTNLTLTSSDVIELTLGTEKGILIRPAEAVTQVFDIPDAILKQARVLKMAGD